MQFYRKKNPQTGDEDFYEVGTDRYIGPKEFKEGQGFAEQQPQEAPSIRRSGAGFETLAKSPLGSFQSQNNFMGLVKDVIKRKQREQQPLTEQKAYWRTMQRDISPIEEKFRTLSPSEQASIRASRFAASSAHLQGIREEEEYRETRIEDVINSLTDLYNAKYKDTMQSRDAETHKLNMQKLNLQIKELADEGGYEIDDSGNIMRDTSGATVQQIADTIKQIESGGNYEAKGGSGEYGAYQFMPSTWAGWSKDYASQILKQSKYMEMTPENQDKVALWKIQSWANKGYTPSQIASKWNSGEIEWKGKASTGKGGKLPPNKWGQEFSVPDYVNNFNNILALKMPSSELIELSRLTGLSIAKLETLSPEEQKLLKDSYEQISKTDIKTEITELDNVSLYKKVKKTIEEEKEKETEGSVVYGLLIRLYGERLSSTQLSAEMLVAGAKKDLGGNWKF